MTLNALQLDFYNDLKANIQNGLFGDDDTSLEIAQAITPTGQTCSSNTVPIDYSGFNTLWNDSYQVTTGTPLTQTVYQEYLSLLARDFKVTFNSNCVLNSYVEASIVFYVNTSAENSEDLPPDYNIQQSWVIDIDDVLTSFENNKLDVNSTLSILPENAKTLVFDSIDFYLGEDQIIVIQCKNKNSPQIHAGNFFSRTHPASICPP